MIFRNIHRNVKYCGICGAEAIKLNRASTSFCGECHYDITRGGNVDRMVSHPLYWSQGYRIKKTSPDYEMLSTVGLPNVRV